LQEEHLEFLVSSGLHGIAIAGTNGKAATLTLEEKSRLVSLVVPAIVFADGEERESARISFFKVIHFAHGPRLARTENKPLICLRGVLQQAPGLPQSPEYEAEFPASDAPSTGKAREFQSD
jgi:hypothetical protein